MLHSSSCMLMDIIIMENHIPSLQSVKDYLGKCFAMKDLGEVAFIIGIKNRDRSKRLIRLGQNAYMDKILKRYKIDNSKRGHIPMQERLDFNKTQGVSTPKEVKLMQNVPYASAVGSIMYAVICTRPDVAFAQNITSLFQQNPDTFLVCGGNPKAKLRLDCYCDTRFETDRDDTKSQTRYVIILNKGSVDWKSSKQSTTTMSTTKAKYIAASEVMMESVWIRKFISGLGIRMFCDNLAALHFANEPRVQRGARHYHRRYHYVCESIALGKIRFLKVHTYDNLADPFTKALSITKHTQHARKLRVASSSYSGQTPPPRGVLIDDMAAGAAFSITKGNLATVDFTMSFYLTVKVNEEVEIEESVVGAKGNLVSVIIDIKRM
nr:retrotransposon protein, putative, Ty1-copia subclass [Tanacetum cinerariifolium]